MRSSRVIFALLAAVALIHSAAALAADIDMDDPRRTVGRENDVRVDAQLIHDTVAPGMPVGVTYQIHNQSNDPVAIAEKVASASYDEDSATITLAVGAEVPDHGRMPHLVVIAPGEKKVFRTGATPVFSAAALRGSSRTFPRFVQVKVSLLRNLERFRPVIDRQPKPGATKLTDAQFDLWFESTDTIFLNAVPVRFSPTSSTASYSADQRAARTRF